MGPTDPFHPFLSEERGGCFTCRWFGKRVGYEVWCNDPRGPMMRSVPIQGCAFWQREPGSDDEPAKTGPS